MLYSFDTSALIDAWTKWYRPKSHPSFWEKVESLSINAELAVSDAVLIELSEKDDDIHKWINERKHTMCIDSNDDIQFIVREISNKYPNLRKSGIPSVLSTFKCRI